MAGTLYWTSLKFDTDESKWLWLDGREVSSSDSVWKS